MVTYSSLFPSGFQLCSLWSDSLPGTIPRSPHLTHPLDFHPHPPGFYLLPAFPPSPTSGKSTVGNDIATRLSLPFIDGDTLHPASNIAKMSAGHPLDDNDRLPWLALIRSTAERICKEQYESRGHDGLNSIGQGRAGVVIACSALKRWYRDILRGEVEAIPPPVNDLVGAIDSTVGGLTDDILLLGLTVHSISPSLFAITSYDFIIGSMAQSSSARPLSNRKTNHILTCPPGLSAIYVPSPAPRQPHRHIREERPTPRHIQPPHPLLLLPGNARTPRSAYSRAQKPLYGRSNARVAIGCIGRSDHYGRERDICGEYRSG